MPRSYTYLTTIQADPDGASMTSIEVPFDPREVFGKARPPVIVKVGSHSYHSTIFNMDGQRFIPLRQSNRAAAGVTAMQRVSVTLTLDEKTRTVKAPADLLSAIKAANLTAAWKSLSHTHQREHVKAIAHAKKTETRDLRIAASLAMLQARPAKPAAKSNSKPTPKRKSKPKSKANR